MNTMGFAVDLYAYHGGLPSGCKYCGQGAKMVILVTGLCDDKCFYCPVSPEKLYKDVVYVDEEPAISITRIIEEAYAIGAEGAGITGGDPLIKLDRTIKIIKVLKEVFGDGFHIHLYTSGRHLTVDALVELEKAGLDELRLHPTREELWRKVELAVKHAEKLDVGVEVPVFPDKLEELWNRILWLDGLGVKFINLNELEYAPHNIEQFTIRGYSIVAGKPVIRGSAEAALELVRRAVKHRLRIKVHYCSARFKDYVQMRLRLIRKALRVAKYYERVTSDGLLEYLEAPRIIEDSVLEDVGETAGDKLLLPVEFLEENRVSGRIVRRYPSLYGSKLVFEIDSVPEKSYDPT